MKRTAALTLALAMLVSAFVMVACEATATKTGTAPNTSATTSEEYTVEPQPVKDAVAPEAVVVGQTRVQLLSNGLVRIEQADSDGNFCDLPSFNCVNRDKWYSVGYTVDKGESETRITTERYTVVVPNDSKKLKGVYVTDESGETIWKFEAKTSNELFLPSPGDELAAWYFSDSPRVIMSENGYALPEDGSYEDKNGWTVDTSAVDAFVFVPDGDYKDFLKNFVTLTGSTDMIPINGLGFWYSHYCNYTPELMKDDLDQFVKKGCPVDIVVCDVDWHTKEFYNDHDLPYGYTLNTELIPDAKAFYDLIHSYGVQVFFNDHPHPVDGTTNVLDKAEIEYRTENLIKYLDLGLDYWWYDRNWPGTCLNKVTAKLSQYVTGQYMFTEVTSNFYKRLAEANGEEYARRTMVLSNVDSIEAGLIQYASEIASHRYSVQWTGDIQGNTDSLWNEIRNAVIGATEMNLPYMSCDLGGHVTDCTDNGYARWIQFGALAPICRVHAFSNWDRKPWNYGEQAESVAMNYIKMRYRLMPTFYSLSHENYESGLPLIRRLDINYPEFDESGRNDEYLLGDYILVAPISEDSGEDTRTVFIPTGTWIDVFSGKEYTGPQTVTVTHMVETSPVFVRAGAIVVLADEVTRTSDIDWSKITLDLYPSSEDSAKATLYEDDTKTEAYKDGHFRTTDITMNYADGVISLGIAKAIGEFDGTSSTDMRTYNLRLHMRDGFDKVTKITVDGREVEFSILDKDADVMPFMTDGAARDNKIVTASFSAPVYKGAEVKIYSSAAAEPDANADYDNSSLNFTASFDTVKSADLSGLNVSEEGTLGWTVFGMKAGEANIVSGKGDQVNDSADAELKSVFGKWDRLIVNGDAVKFDLNFVTYGDSYEVLWNDGEEENSQSSFLSIARHSLHLNVATVGQPAVYKLYLTSLNAGTRVTVSDRAGNTKTFTVDDYTKRETCFVLTVTVDSDAESELCFDITKTSGTEGTNDAVLVSAVTVSNTD